MLPKVQFLKTYILFVGIVAFGFIYLSLGELIPPSLSNELIFPEISPQLFLAKNVYVEHPNQNIEVEVLNGCGVPFLAAKTTDYLRSKHFDVVFSGNAKNQLYQHTMILQRNEKIESLKKIADSFGLELDDSKHIIIVPDESLCLDVTVILGADYRKFEELMAHIFNSPFEFFVTK